MRRLARLPGGSLAWRFSLAFVLVAALALGVVGLVVGATTRRGFDDLLGAQARAEYAAAIERHVRDTGSLAGFVPPRFTGGPGRSRDHADRPDRPARPEDGGGPRFDRGPLLVLDPERRAVLAAPDVPLGTRVTNTPPRDLTPVVVDGRTVAYLAPSRFRPRPDARSAEFLGRTYRALALALLGAAVAAIAAGVLLSRTLLRPLRALLEGIRAMERGETPPPLPGGRRDEFGEVLGAFNTMSAEVRRAQDARRQLTANIAHDLNTPLAVISGTLEGMLDGTFAATPDRLARLHRETGHVASLVSDLRFLSLADAGELRLRRDPTDAAALVRDAATGLREVAERRGVALTVDAAPAVVPLDPTRVTQVLHNLLGNALAHTPPGGSVRVEARPEGAAWRVSVRDTGTGIAPEDLAHVFDRLYRADRARSEGGSGLGLAICRSIVEAHGGRIVAESAPGAGTIVTFTLPVALPAASAPSSPILGG